MDQELVGKEKEKVGKEKEKVGMEKVGKEKEKEELMEQVSRIGSDPDNMLTITVQVQP